MILFCFATLVAHCCWYCGARLLLCALHAFVFSLHFLSVISLYIYCQIVCATWMGQLKASSNLCLMWQPENEYYICEDVSANINHNHLAHGYEIHIFHKRIMFPFYRKVQVLHFLKEMHSIPGNGRVFLTIIQNSKSSLFLFHCSIEFRLKNGSFYLWKSKIALLWACHLKFIDYRFHYKCASIIKHSHSQTNRTTWKSKQLIHFSTRLQLHS